MVMLHNAIKQFKMGFLCFFLKEQKLVSFQGCFFLMRIFLDPDYLSILFCDFPLIARSGISHVTISLIRCAPHS